MTDPARRWRALLVATADWVAVAAAASAVFAVVVIVGGAWLGEPQSSHLGLSLVAAVVVAVMVEPVRRWTDARVRRWVADPKTEPYEVLRDFTDRLSASESVEDLTRQMAEVLGRGTRARWTQVWLNVRGEFQLAASWPPGAAGATAPGKDEAGVDRASERLDLSTPSAAGGGIRVVPVGHDGEIAGLLRVAEQPGRPLTQVELRLFADLARQAALLLGRAQVLTELHARVEELAAQSARLREARLQLITAADEERRRLERDLHDGAQQQLVALSINLGLAETLAASGSGAAAVVREQVPVAGRAIATLLALAAGRGPQQLAQTGLSQALEAMASQANPQVEVRVPTLGRFEPGIEEALYFCASEAVQNAIKHSGGDCVVVEAAVGHAAAATQGQGTLAASVPALTLTVTDNGAGLPEHIRGGSGLSSMRARVDAVQGKLELTSVPGGGTTVTVHVPIRAAGEEEVS